MQAPPTSPVEPPTHRVGSLPKLLEPSRNAVPNQMESPPNPEDSSFPAAPPTDKTDLPTNQVEPPKKLRVSYEDENTKEAQEKGHVGALAKVSTTRTHRMSGLFRNLQDISKVNFLSSTTPTPQATECSRSSLLPSRIMSLQTFPNQLRSDDGFQPTEQFPKNVTSLMNEDKLWGCYYVFPELYEDAFSPTVKIRTSEELPEEETKDGVLTRDLISTCLSYLSRSPITGEYVYIKLNLYSKHLQDVSALESYHYIQYLDISKNLLTDLQVLTNLPYLQYLSVAFNRLTDVLDYKTPQWFLSEVHYRYNYVKKIRDLTPFWSITVLDLSHNNIKAINGLNNLRYLRKLDLSFNHIQRFENLTNMRLSWLDISYNNISSFESGPSQGLKTLLHLEFLDMNENQLTSLKIFSGCSSIRELHTRNNRLDNILELALYMRKLRCLSILDLRENPICSATAYRTVVMHTMPNLLRLDDEYIDPVEQATMRMEMAPNVMTQASRQLLRLMYVEQLTLAGGVTKDIPPADTTEVPIVVLVGAEASGKGKLCRRLAAECSTHVRHALLHTTATYHDPTHYRTVSRDKMDDMLVSGQLLAYSEKYGESYGLSRADAFVSENRVVVTSMEQLPALMLRLRCRRPYLLLVYSSDDNRAARLETRRRERLAAALGPQQASTLQVLVSGRIDVTGILHEIIMSLPDDRQRSSFQLASDCSLKPIVSICNAPVGQNDSILSIPTPVELAASHQGTKESLLPFKEGARSEQNHNVPSLHSLYKSQGTGDYSVEVHWQPSSVEVDLTLKKDSEQLPSQFVPAMMAERPSFEKPKRLSSEISKPKSAAGTSRYTTSTWKDSALSSVPSSKSVLPVASGPPDSTKSVTFLSRERETVSLEHLGRLTGLLLENQEPSPKTDLLPYSISKKIPPRDLYDASPQGGSKEDRMTWCSLMHELGLLQAADELHRSGDVAPKDSGASNQDKKTYNQMMSLGKLWNAGFEEGGSTVEDTIARLHRKCPGIFWDTLNSDDLEKAFCKLKRVVKDIVNSQSKLKPMFDVDFRKSDVPIVCRRRAQIMKEIAPTRTFI